ncbi:HNH endonuclease [Nonomuraea jabiensis]|uniref:HNH endonuclease n=1 Tax=Nonomuraea jabiensis TaxID=882448 RepID=UPI0036C21AF1
MYPPLCPYRIPRSYRTERYPSRPRDSTHSTCVLPHGQYAEGAHIRPLGSPHDGHDVAGNLLCLCPNDHVLFDQGAIIVKADLTVVNRLTGESRGPLRTVAGHDIDPQYLAYHRNITDVTARATQGDQSASPLRWVMGSRTTDCSSGVIAL